MKNRHVWCWIRNALRFELIYRLFTILLLHPLCNALLNLYINHTSYHSSLANYNMLFDFLTLPGLLLLAFIALIAVLSVVFEILTLTAMTACMIHRIEYRTTDLFSLTFARLRNLRHPSVLAALVYFLGLIPLTHIGYVSSFLTTVEVPEFIIGELSLTMSGQIMALLFYLLVFAATALCAFVPIALLREKTSFWQAVKQSVQALRALKRSHKIGFALLFLLLFLLHYALMRFWQTPVLKNSDFNIYLFRYFYHSYYFRKQFAVTVLYWGYLFAASMIFTWLIIKLYESSAAPVLLAPKAGRPFFATRVGMRLKRLLTRGFDKLEERFYGVRHKHVAVIGACVVMTFAMLIYLNQEPLVHAPLVIGHRGDIYAPENSLEGIESAALRGADYAEIDIQFTGDDELVVFHDSSTKRLSDQNLTVADHTLARLQQVDLVSRRQHFTMPSLEEAIRCAQDAAEPIGLLIELKPRDGEAKQMARELVALIERYDFARQAIFMSMDYEAIQELQRLRPGWRIGYCIFGALGNVEPSLNVDFLAIEESQVNTLFLEQARKNHIPVYVWTVDDYYAILSYLRMGVSGIIGNSVEDIREAVDDYEKNDPQSYLTQEETTP